MPCLEPFIIELQKEKVSQFLASHIRDVKMGGFMFKSQYEI